MNMKRHDLMIACLIVGPVTLLALRTTASAQSISVVPTRSASGGSPAATWGDPIDAVFNGSCWEYRMAPGGEQVQINIMAGGWGQAVGVPTLGAIQVTVMAAGYDNGLGDPLVPLGWPGTPLYGAYMPKAVCGLGGDGRPCVAPFSVSCAVGGGFCVHNPDYIMPIEFSDILPTLVSVSSLDYVWATAASVGSVTDPGVPKVLGTLVLEVPEDAEGTYVIALNEDPKKSFMVSGFGVPITGITFTPACITITTIESPIRAPAPDDILKNRYISIDPLGALGSNPSSLHIRVMVDSSEVNGHAGFGPWWAEPPDARCISYVTTTKPAVEPDWSACPVVHLTGCPIIPTTTYAIAVESGGSLSVDALLATQAKPGVKFHGDVVGFFNMMEWTAPNGNVNIDDAVAAIKTFQNPSKLPGCGSPPCNATHTSVTDIAPNLVPTRNNKIVSIEDVLLIILGFHGQEYPGPDLTGCP